MSAHAEDGRPEPVGSVAEEASRLLEVLSGWASTGAEDHERDTGADATASCAWCPLCRVVHAVTHTSPEVRQHLAAAADSLLQAVLRLVDTDPRTHDGPAAPHPTYDEGEHTS